MAAAITISVTTQSFDPDAAYAAFRREHGDAGAIVSFLGQVRSEDGAVTALTLEHYPGLTEREIGAIAARAAERWSVSAIAIVHRAGELPPGAPIVFVAAAAPHRRAAFESADYLMDYLKSEAPFWKRETRGDQSVWIEPRAGDYVDRDRWTEKKD